jgi:hypothetical protein
MAFKASKGKSGLFEVHGIEEFLEKKLAELRKALGLGGAASPKKAVKKSQPKKPANVKKPATAVPTDPAAQLLKALDGNAKKAALIKAGKQKDQLLRSLIPLYVARNVNAEVSSGVTSKFWAKFGVKYAAPNAAKALREHGGYSKRTKNGNQITPNGVKYVESALKA